LEYVTLGTNARNRIDKSVLFVATVESGQPKLAVYTIPITYSAMAERCQDFREACSDRNVYSYNRKAQELYRLLIAPAAKLLAGKRRLLICPDGPLWEVPFQALLDSNSKHLMERYELVYSSSATSALAAKESKHAKARAQPTYTMLAVANPDFGDAGRFNELGTGGAGPVSTPSRGLYGVQRAGINPLPGTHLEAQALHTLFPDSTILEGKDAQEARVKKEMSKYRYLHFATHGLYNNAAPMLSSIVLAQPPKDDNEDGFLTAGEIFDMKLSADLVTLSACESARGQVRKGEGVVGLTWALFAAGVPSAVVSQWKVDDTSTPQLMGVFYGGLKRGEGKAAALRKAALKLMHDGTHSHPYFWAPFVLVGDWN